MVSGSDDGDSILYNRQSKHDNLFLMGESIGLQMNRTCEDRVASRVSFAEVGQQKSILVHSKLCRILDFEHSRNHRESFEFFSGEMDF